MFKLNLKIALRNLKKNFGITLISIGGLAIALAAFMLMMMYVNYETSYDKNNPEYKNIYLVGRNMQEGYKTNYTAPPLAKLIEQNCPEVTIAGKMKPSGMEFAAISEQAKIYIKRSLTIDYKAAKIFRLAPENGLEKPAGKDERLFYLDKASVQILFPEKRDNMPEMIALGSKGSGQTAKVQGSIIPDLHSNVTFDALSVANEIGEEEGFGYPNYFTYIRVKAGTDIKNLESKITMILKKGMIEDGYKSNSADVMNISAYLDPLAHLHLRPRAGNDSNYKIVIAIAVLGFLILLIACINFTNLSIAQANKRAKEVGIKKVLGSYRYILTLQFIAEIFIQCMLATILGLIIAELLLPSFNNLFEVPLSIWHGSSDFFLVIPSILITITLIAGIYPALILSGYKPATVLKGNFQTSIQSQWLRKGLLVFQFTIAVVFIAVLLIVSDQIKYMRTQDKGFNADQVVSIKNISIFNDPKVFAAARERMLKIKGIKTVTVSNVIPDGSSTGANGYVLAGKEADLDFIDVDFDYFETLEIKLKEGRFFSDTFKTDTANSAILNESAVAKYGVQNPVGKIIRGCNIDYKVVGIIKDFKSQGFENAVQPTIYALKNPCGNPRTSIMVKINQNHTSAALTALKAQWSEINKLDGEDFRYEFLDELYGRLFKKQEQLQSLFFAASLLTIFIATLGLFAFAKFMTNNRIKEIAVRKILGANDFQILSLLNSSFLWMVFLSNIIALPLAYVLARKWLETFAYSISLTLTPFLISGLITVLLTLVTVSVQAAKAVKANPVKALKYE